MLPLQLCRIKKYFYLSGTYALLVVCSFSQNNNSSFMFPEWIYLTKASNWAYEVTSVDSSVWKENIGDAFIYHLVFHTFRHIWNAPLNSIGGRDICLIFASLASPRNSFIVFNKQGFTNIFPIAWGFCLAISRATSRDACLLGGEFRQDKSLTFQTRFMASEEYKLFVAWLGCFVSKRRINFEGFIHLALRALYTTAIRFFLSVDCNFTKWTVGMLSYSSGGSSR